MTTWFSSDWHIGHKNILIYCAATRPFVDVDHMARELIARHNAVVQDDDVVYNVGDFALSEKYVPIVLPQLKGKITLIAGNHDACWKSRKNNAATIKRYLDYGFKEVLFETIVEPFLVNHMPYVEDERHKERYSEYRPKNEGRPLLHGHSHGNLGKFHHGNQIDVGVDCWDCAPVSYETLLEVIK
jgi:calcineurin-like phosphoesterase family protein